MPIKTLKKGVQAALPVIETGGSFLVQCKAGVHRIGAPAVCVLIAMGYIADDAMQIIKRTCCG